MMNNRPLLLVFADDWGRHPSSCQHLIGRLLDRYEVIWVNTIGTRPPRFNWSTVTRAWEKIRHWTKTSVDHQTLPKNLQVLNPRMWPSFRSSFGRWLNRRLLVRQLGPYLQSAAREVIGITVLPIIADLVGELPVSRWVYYCVDDFGLWPGLDQDVLLRMDEELINKVDTRIAVSETLRRKIAALGKSAHLLTHGVDIDFWRASDVNHNSLPCLEGLSPPFVAFWGVVDRRMDVVFLEQLVKDMTEGAVLLVGPDVDSDPALSALPRVARIPPLLFEELPALASAASVLVMPYADLPVTRAIQPLKLKEYMSTGLPVVSRNLPASREWHDCLDLVDTPEEFSHVVRMRMQSGLPKEQKIARERLTHESWEEKAIMFEKWAIHDQELATMTTSSDERSSAVGS